MDSSSTNVVRGKMQFENKLNQEVQHPDTLNFLKEYFINHIGVMEVKETLSNDLLEAGYEPRVEIFAAIRMARACLELSDEYSEYDTYLYGVAIDRYLGYSVAPPVKPEYNIEITSHEQTNFSLMEEIINANIDDYREIGDVNNLIGEVEESELSIEGKRAAGYLPKDFDTLDPNQDTTSLDVNKLSLAILTTDEDGNPLLNCPNCFSTSICDLGYSRFSCIDCDTVFKSPLNLGDLLPEDALSGVVETEVLPWGIQYGENDYIVVPTPDSYIVDNTKPEIMIKKNDEELKELMELLEVNKS